MHKGRECCWREFRPAERKHSHAHRMQQECIPSFALVRSYTKPTYPQELGRAELWPKAGNHRCSATRVGGREKFGMLHRLQPTTVARHYTPTLAQAWLTGCTGKKRYGLEMFGERAFLPNPTEPATPTQRRPQPQTLLGFLQKRGPSIRAGGRAGGQAGLQKVASHPRWNILGDRTTTTHNVQH